MSLLEALLLDPQRINTWLALRNDEVLGSGTQTDPYNASPRLDVKVSINLGSGLTNVGTEATANATNSYTDGDIVVISGAADPAFNGIFVIYGRTTTLFKYRMDTTPAVTGGTLSSAQKALELRFDTVMSTLVGANTCVHLGPGVIATRGYYIGTAAWQAQSGMRIVEMVRSDFCRINMGSESHARRGDLELETADPRGGHEALPLPRSPSRRRGF